MDRGIATSTFDSSTPVWNVHTGVEESKVEFHGVEIAILGLDKYWGGKDSGEKKTSQMDMG